MLDATSANGAQADRQLVSLAFADRTGRERVVRCRPLPTRCAATTRPIDVWPGSLRHWNLPFLHPAREANPAPAFKTRMLLASARPPPKGNFAEFMPNRLTIQYIIS